MKPRAVAKIFDVTPRTVIEWVQSGKLRGLRTPGGQQYRIYAAEVDALLSAGSDIETDEHSARRP